MSLEHKNANQIHKFAYVQSTDPGAVGASKGWVDTSSGPPFQFKVRNASNTDWYEVGNNGSNFNSGLTTLSEYGDSLATAVATIGTTDKVILSVVNPVTVSANLTMPDNIQLDPRAIITVNNGVNLTINSMIDPGNRQIFNTNATNARVKFTKGAVEFYNTAWWAGTDTDTNITKAIEQARLSCVDNQGGTIYIPEGRFITNGGHFLADCTTIAGGGNFVDSYNGGTTLKLQSPTASFMWKIGEGEFGNRFKDILFDGTGTSGRDCILLEGSYPNTSGDLAFDRVTITSFGKGINYNSLAGSWQFAQIKLDHCIFLNNVIGIRSTSLNSEFALESVNFSIPAGGWAMDAIGGGIINFKSSEFAGAGSTSGVMRIGGAHVQYNFIGCQDEGCGVFIENNASDVSGIINLIGCLVQAKIQINASCVLNSFGNNYLSKTFQFGGVGTLAYITSTGDHIRQESIDGLIINPPRLTELADGGSLITLEQNTINFKHTHRIPTRFLSPLLLEGNPTDPIVGIAHRTTLGESKRLLRLGRMDATETFDFYYDFWRQNSGSDAGRLKLQGNQTGFLGLDFNGDIYSDGPLRSKSLSLTDGATITIDSRASNYFYVTLGGNRTLDLLSLTGTDQDRADGQKITVELKQDGTGSRTITAGTNITVSSGLPLTLSTTAGKYDLLTLVYSKRANKWFAADLRIGY